MYTVVKIISLKFKMAAHALYNTATAASWLASSMQEACCLSLVRQAAATAAYRRSRHTY